MLTSETLKARRKDSISLAAHYGAHNVRVFGSVARGEAGGGSDVDFVVVFDPDRSLFDHGGLQMDMQELLGCKVDVISERGMRPRLRERILKEAVSL